MKEKQDSKSSNVIVGRRERRYFSEEARKAIVEEIDNGLSKSEASRKYEVSLAAIYKWLAKYSKTYVPALVKVVEHASAGNKVKELEAELERVYALLGRQKAENLLLEKILEVADEAQGTDLKKSFDAQRSQLFTPKKKPTK
jgi:transposase-like protein